MAARCATEVFSTTCAVHIEDCEGWWSSGAEAAERKYDWGQAQEAAKQPIIRAKRSPLGSTALGQVVM